MPNAFDAVLADAMKLTPEQRVELIEALAETVLPAPPLGPQWQAEISRRVRDMEAGRTRFMPAEEFLATLAERLRQRRPAA